MNCGWPGIQNILGGYVQENLVIQVRMCSRGSGAVVYGSHGEQWVIVLDVVRGTFGSYGLNGAADAMAREPKASHLRSRLRSICKH